MKKLVLLAIFLISVLMITACANKDKIGTEEPNDSTTDIESQETLSVVEDVAKMVDELDFTRIDFDVHYEEAEFEGQIKNGDLIVESEFYDPFNGFDERGRAAIEAILPFLKNLDLNKDMTDEDAIAEAIRVFNIPDDFLKAELDLTFKDGTEKLFIISNN